MIPSTIQNSLAAVGPFGRDAACKVSLAVACLLLRLPSLDRVSLNPDESQYEAMGSYLAATGTSAFVPLSAPGTFGVFKTMTQLFGPYPMFEVRVLVTLLCLAVTLLLFELVRRETNRWCGLAAGLVFLHFTMYYQGLTVNREWFAATMSMGAIALFALSRAASPVYRNRLLLVSGLISGGALLFKLQAAFIVLAVPAVIAWQGVVERRWRPPARALAFHATGGILAGVFYLLPFYLAGTLSEFVGLVFTDWTVFVVGNEQVIKEAAASTPAMYFQRYYWHQPHRPLLLAAFGFSVVSIGRAIVTAIRPENGRDSFVSRPGVLVFVAYLVSAAACVQLGNRFFAHYYLLMMPAVAALCGLCLYGVVSAAKRGAAGRWLALGFVALFVLDRAILLSARTPSEILASWPRYAVVVSYVLAVVAILAFGALAPWRRVGVVAAALLTIESGVLVFQQQRAETPASMSHSPYRYDQLASYLRAAAAPGDRLFVWGWAPEIYSLTRLESASLLASSEYVVNDFLAAPVHPSINRHWEEILMRDLHGRKPRFIVDASARSWTSTEPWVYRLERYPELELVDLLRTRYVSRGRFDGCEVFERVRDSP